ncbi:MAG: acyl-CoA dehydrogenase family protein [Chloroflexota bacterium]
MTTPTGTAPSGSTEPTGPEERGGSFLTGPTAPERIFTPEQLSEEHRAIRSAIEAFVAREVGPRRDAVEGKDYATHRELLARLGRDGYLGIDVPEAHGGAGLDRVASVVVTEALAGADSFAVTYSAHTGIGTLPLIFFGTDDQRRRYLPGLVAGTTVGAYALTEPSAGSDARAIRARANRQPDGSFVIDGTKQFITNAGFADLFTIYAKVDGEEFTAFLVERASQGITIGPEEHKLGVHGASTCAVTLDGVRVPAENVLGEIGKGHRVAYNVLNVGRFKLAAGCLGGMKSSIAVAYAYARERQAFGRRIVEFPLIGGKLAAMAARTYGVESVVYRVAGLIDARLGQAEESGSPEAIRAALEEYAVECSIAKVLASEELGWVVDELIQVHGGYGYIEEYPAARAFRDARIHRIWEGTNEINRLLIPGTLLKRAVQGRLDLLGPARRAQEALLAPSGGDAGDAAGGPLAAEAALVEAARQVTLLLAGAAFQRFGSALDEQQEVLAGVADLAIGVLVMDSAVARARRAGGVEPSGLAPDRAGRHVDLARLVVAERAAQLEMTARAIAPSLADGDEARLLVAGVRRFLRSDPIDRVALGRQVAGHVAAAAGYPV